MTTTPRDPLGSDLQIRFRYREVSTEQAAALLAKAWRFYLEDDVVVADIPL